MGPDLFFILHLDSMNKNVNQPIKDEYSILILSVHAVHQAVSLVSRGVTGFTKRAN